MVSEDTILPQKEGRKPRRKLTMPSSPRVSTSEDDECHSGVAK
jgi:hypothetical protein